MIAAVLAFARSRAGRALFAALGLALVGLLVHLSGAAEVADALTRLSPWLVALVALEGIIVALDALTLRALFDVKPRLGEVLRATILAYPLAALAPAGRTIAEGAKAAMLATTVGAASATVAAARIQGLVLLSGFALSLAAGLVALFALDATIAGWACLGNAALVGAIGLGIMGAGRLKPGARLSRLLRRGERVGAEVDEIFSGAPILPLGPLLMQCGARACLVTQLTLLIGAAASIDAPRAIVAGGLFLVGTSVGDLIPAQLGATEANFVLSAALLGLARSEAIAIPMLVRGAQLAWALVGLVWPLTFGRRS